MPEQKFQISNQAAFELGERIKTMFYKSSVKVEDIYKSMLADPLLKGLDPEKVKRFVYSTLHMSHELENKIKDVQK